MQLKFQLQLNSFIGLKQFYKLTQLIDANVKMFKMIQFFLNAFVSYIFMDVIKLVY